MGAAKLDEEIIVGIVEEIKAHDVGDILIYPNSGPPGPKNIL